MQDFTHGDKTIEFTSLVGEVIGSEKLSETHVSSSGGGGYVGREGGHVRAAQISSTSVINHEFWVRDDTGIEHDVKLKGQDIPLRTGQRITLIKVKHKNGSGKGWYSIIVNHSAAKHWFLNSAPALNQLLGLQSLHFKVMMIGIAVIAILGYLTGAYMFAFLAGVGYLVYRYTVDFKCYKKMETRLNLHLEQLAQQAYDNDRARQTV
ncbi:MULTISPECIES: hypothetical protein [Pseudomonas syringae group]|uniref:hypothetical protein n=1 Tax=Pseudomonas syringae group TaxID=136849 RepID=UPI0006B90152|nr:MULTISPECIES: hypothetical protein [Pseudomonas syringae group]MBM0212917.1 hypothetical protein [Pseudomonas syringae pv. maculicola]QQN24938.1 hypothetical protein JHZ65_14500 [Pseudomonas syringae pv. maculicola]QXG45602.1 hypothetical protein KTT57_18475 [Pseudomonas viridiflava]RMM69800.1 hypothetical protein ALQ72_01435 [Pseudomonas syringae pv. maculicola]